MKEKSIKLHKKILNIIFGSALEDTEKKDLLFLYVNNLFFNKDDKPENNKIQYVLELIKAVEEDNLKLSNIRSVAKTASLAKEEKKETVPAIQEVVEPEKNDEANSIDKAEEERRLAILNTNYMTKGVMTKHKQEVKAEENTKIENKAKFDLMKYKNATLYLNEFERLWMIYPRKQNKLDAQAVYFEMRDNNLLPDVETLLYCINNKKSDDKKYNVGAPFFKYLHNYLKDRSFEDYLGTYYMEKAQVEFNEKISEYTNIFIEQSDKEKGYDPLVYADKNPDEFMTPIEWFCNEESMFVDLELKRLKLVEERNSLKDKYGDLISLSDSILKAQDSIVGYIKSKGLLRHDELYNKYVLSDNPFLTDEERKELKEEKKANIENQVKESKAI